MEKSKTQASGRDICKGKACQHTHRHTHKHTHSKKFLWVRCRATGGRSIANNNRERHALLFTVLKYSKCASTAAQNTEQEVCPHNGVESGTRAKCEEVMEWDKFSGNDFFLGGGVQNRDYTQMSMGNLRVRTWRECEHRIFKGNNEQQLESTNLSLVWENLTGVHVRGD